MGGLGASGLNWWDVVAITEVSACTEKAEHSCRARLSARHPRRIPSHCLRRSSLHFRARVGLSEQLLRSRHSLALASSLPGTISSERWWGSKSVFSTWIQSSLRSTYIGIELSPQMDDLVLAFCFRYIPKNCQFLRLTFPGLKKSVFRGKRKFFSFFLFILLLLENLLWRRPWFPRGRVSVSRACPDPHKCSVFPRTPSEEDTADHALGNVFCVFFFFCLFC